LAYSYQEKHQEALAAFDKAIILGRDDSFAYSCRAEEYAALGKFDKAEEDFKHAKMCNFIENIFNDNEKEIPMDDENDNSGEVVDDQGKQD
jgi:tetratricopeptide (TPR) repeat protein